MKYTVKKLNKGEEIEKVGRITVTASATVFVVVDESGKVRKTHKDGKAVYDQFTLKIAAEKQAQHLSNN
jgi:hypothetical protein